MIADITLREIEAAHHMVKSQLVETPLVYSPEFSSSTGNEVFFKLENFQITRSFKARGALNKISSLSATERARGVVAASSGNHALGVAFACTLQGIEACVVMPHNAPEPKIKKAHTYGADVLLHGESYDDALAHAHILAAEHGYTLLPSFDDPRIVAGQGTIALEVLDRLPQLDLIVAPIGGGGLVSGLALALAYLDHPARVMGVEAASAACMTASLHTGRPTRLPQARTIADGIAVQQPGALNFEIVRRHVSEIHLVEDLAIFESMRLMVDTLGLIAEPAAAAAPAALLHNPALHGKKLTICVVITGGNIASQLFRQVANAESEVAGWPV